MSRSTFDGYNYYRELSKNLAKRQNKVNIKQITQQSKKRIKLISKEQIVGNVLNQIAQNHHQAPKSRVMEIKKSPKTFNLIINSQINKVPQRMFLNLSHRFFNLNKRKFPLKKKLDDEMFLRPSTFLDHQNISAKTIKTVVSGFSDVTLTTLKNFDPKKTSTPLDGLPIIPMMLDPDDAFIDINISKENDINYEEIFHRNVLKIASESTKDIHENTFQNLLNPLEVVVKSIKRVHNVSLEESIRTTIKNAAESTILPELQPSMDETPMIRTVSLLKYCLPKSSTALFSQLSCKDFTSFSCDNSCEISNECEKFEFLPNADLSNNMNHAYISKLLTDSKSTTRNLTNSQLIFKPPVNCKKINAKNLNNVLFNFSCKESLLNVKDSNALSKEKTMTQDQDETQNMNKSMEDINSYLSFRWTPFVNRRLLNSRTSISSTPEMLFPRKNIFKENSFNMF